MIGSLVQTWEKRSNQRRVPAASLLVLVSVFVFSTTLRSTQLLSQNRSGREKKKSNGKKRPLEFTYRQVRQMQKQRQRRSKGPLDNFGQESWWWSAILTALTRQETRQYETDAIRVTLPDDPKDRKASKGLIVPARPVLVVGMPKSGTSSIASFFRCTAKSQKASDRIMRRFSRLGWHFLPYRTVSHYSCLGGGSCGKCFADFQRKRRMFGRQRTLEACGNYHVWTQLDTSQGGDCVFPQMDYLLQITKEQPYATFLLNQRNASSWVRSIDGWFEKRSELDSCALRGDLRNFPLVDLSAAVNKEEDWDTIVKPTDEDYEQWYQRHSEFIRWYVKRNPTHTLIEVDIEKESAGADLANLFWGGGSRFARLVHGERQEVKELKGWGSLTEEEAQKCWGQKNSANHYAKLRSGWVARAKNAAATSDEAKESNPQQEPLSRVSLQDENFDDDDLLALQELRRMEWRMNNTDDAPLNYDDAKTELLSTFNNGDVLSNESATTRLFGADGDKSDNNTELFEATFNLTSRDERTNEMRNNTTHDLGQEEDMVLNQRSFGEGFPREFEDEELEPGLEGPIVLVGLPQTGVHYIESFFRCSARPYDGKLKKWRISPPTSHRQRTCGSNGHQACATCFERALRRGEDMFRKCGGYDVWSRTEDVPPQKKNQKQKCILPQADMIEDISQVAPDAVFILTKWQSPQQWLESLQKKFVRKRLLGCDFLRNWPSDISSPHPNATNEDFLQWHENHVQFVRRHVQRHPTHSLLEITVDDPKDHNELHRLLRCRGDVPMPVERTNLLEEDPEGNATLGFSGPVEELRR